MKTLFIVGGSSGIGYETCSLFLKSGYRVINVSRTPCSLEGVENHLCDVTVREKLDEILRFVAKEHIDCFVYSAGFSMASPLEYALEGDYRYLFEVNFFAYLHCLQTLIPVLRRSNGVAVSVSSLAAVAPIPFDCYYSASKAALNTLAEALSFELEQDGIRVFSVMPGATKTDFTKKRKVYPPASIDGYSHRMSLATEKLAKTEQNGSSPKKVAKTIFLTCTEQHAVPVLSAPISSKFIRFFAKIMPLRLKQTLIKCLFFMEENDGV